MNQRRPQVDAVTHYRRRYLTLPRMITHWHQANEVANCCPEGGSVLEVGPGSGHTTWILANWGFRVTTLDVDPDIGPTVVADVNLLPFAADAFDCVIAAEVLEHLPFDRFVASLRELARVSRRFVVVTLPAPFLGISALFNWPRFEPKGLFLGLPFWVRHRFNGEHYWEFGKRGYGGREVRMRIAEAGLRLARGFRPAPSLYCYFFVLEKT